MAKQQSKKCSKNLGDAEIKKIVEILDGWSASLLGTCWLMPLSYVFNRHTRQELYKHERIRNAFELKKSELGCKGVTRVASLQMQIDLDRIACLKSKNRRLESENNQLLEQFAR